MEVAHIDVFRRDPARFWQLLRPALRRRCDDKRPERRAPRAGRARAARRARRRSSRRTSTACTRAAGTEDLIEVHGSIAHRVVPGVRRAATRSSGGARAARRPTPDGVPRCDCGAPLKPDVVLFGEMLPEAAIERALRARRRAPTCCSASAPRSRSTRWPGCRRSRSTRGGAIAIVTQGPTPYDGAPRSSSTATWSRSSRRCSPPCDQRRMPMRTVLVSAFAPARRTLSRVSTTPPPARRSALRSRTVSGRWMTAGLPGAPVRLVTVRAPARRLPAKGCVRPCTAQVDGHTTASGAAALPTRGRFARAYTRALPSRRTSRTALVFSAARAWAAGPAPASCGRAPRPEAARSRWGIRRADPT